MVSSLELMCRGDHIADAWMKVLRPELPLRSCRCHLRGLHERGYYGAVGGAQAQCKSIFEGQTGSARCTCIDRVSLFFCCSLIITLCQVWAFISGYGQARYAIDAAFIPCSGLHSESLAKITLRSGQASIRANIPRSCQTRFAVPTKAWDQSSR